MNALSDNPTQNALRLWPGIAVVVIQLLARYVIPQVAPDLAEIGVMTSLACGLLVALWWVLFSKAPGRERWAAALITVVSLPAAYFFLHESVATGMMGMMFAIYVTPLLSLTFVIWAVFLRNLAPGAHIQTMAAVIVATAGLLTLLRSDGIQGMGAEFAWRWSQTAEAQLLEDATETRQRPIALSMDETAAWPGFRGPQRDSVIRNSQVAKDWSANPPKQMWRRQIGPGWSSFAVQGDLVFTQEQRGEEELVSCYSLSSGEPVWRYADSVRFWEANAGAGPRATPSLHEGRVYTMGATGRVNALNAADGSLVWSRDAAADTSKDIPMWGFSGSPLIVEDMVVIHTGSLIAYDLASGEPRWNGPDSIKYSYGSPHLATLDGVQQIVLLSGHGAVGINISDGSMLWEQPLDFYPIVQPALTGDNHLLVGDNKSSRLIKVERGLNGWNPEVLWQTNRLKPYFNNVVVHAGHAYGFDGRILACIDLEKGERQWKGGRYGNGQLLLLADQNLLLVLTESGEVALVRASAEGFEEVAKIPAIEGKTWNHPVLVDHVLLVRNDREIAAFDLAPEMNMGSAP